MKFIITNIFVAILCIYSYSTQAQPDRRKAFSFELKDTLGRIVRLDDFKGKTLVMDFWFTGCKGCVQVAEGLEHNVIPHFRSDSSVVFIAVSIDVNFLQWKKSIREGIYTSPEEINLFTMGMGGDHPLFRHYGFSGCPQMLLIDKEGYLISSSAPFPGPDLVEMIRNANSNAAASSSRGHESGSILIGTIVPNGDLKYAGKAFLTINSYDTTILDSCLIIDNRFQFSRPYSKQPERATLALQYTHLDWKNNLIRKFKDSRALYFDADTINVIISRNVNNAAVNGDEHNKQFTEYLEATQPIVKFRDSLRAGKASMDAVLYEKQMAEAGKHLKMKQREFVRSHVAFPFTLEVLDRLVRDYLTREWMNDHEDKGLLEYLAIYNQLHPDLKKQGEHIYAQLEKSRQRKIIPFSGEMPDGRTFQSSSLKGKVFLIDFWGSWCIWCRKGHPHLKELYARYKNKGFEIIGIGEEQKKDRSEQWKRFREAIQKDGITWPQILNDPEKVDLVDTYLVTAFPTKILVDREGKILLRVTDDTERKIDAKLKELFNH